MRFLQPVVRKCTEVLSRAIGISCGDFFVRRFHKDGPVLWRLLALSPFRRKRLSLMDEKAIILPYRNTSLTSEEPMAEISSQKIQIAVWCGMSYIWDHRNIFQQKKCYCTGKCYCSSLMWHVLHLGSGYIRNLITVGWSPTTVYHASIMYVQVTENKFA